MAGTRLSEPPSVQSNGGSDLTGLRTRGWFALAAGVLLLQRLRRLQHGRHHSSCSVARQLILRDAGRGAGHWLSTRDPPTGMGLAEQQAMAFTPDGRAIVFSAERATDVCSCSCAGSTSSRPRRSRKLMASNLFMSPCRRGAVGFYADGALKRVSLDGGAARHHRRGRFGASWGRDVGLCSPLRHAQTRVGGGSPSQSPASARREPSLAVSAARRQTVSSTSTRADVSVVGRHAHHRQSLRLRRPEGPRRERCRRARYVSTGHLIYMRRGTLMAVPFDGGRVEVTGVPLPRQRDAGGDSAGADRFGRRQFRCVGLLAYLAASHRNRRSIIGWVDCATGAGSSR